MRYLCGAPNQLPAIAVSTAAAPLFVRAYKASPGPLLKMAHGVSLNVRPKPTCSYGAPLKVVENSSERGGAKKASVDARAPSMLSAPPERSTVVAPPQDTADHPVGSVVPSNSAPTAGASVTSPSLARLMYPPASMVPRLKSATAVSMNPVGGCGACVVKMTST